MLTQQETENLLRLLASKDIKNIMIGLEMAKANGWQIEKVGKILEVLFEILEQANKSLLDIFITNQIRLDENFEEIKSIKTITVGKTNKYPLELILAVLPNLVRFLPWQGEIKASFKLYDEDYDLGKLIPQMQGIEKEDLELIYNTLAQKVGTQTLKEVRRELLEFYQEVEEEPLNKQNFYDDAGSLLLMEKCEKILSNAPKEENKVFKPKISKGILQENLCVFDNQANSWFWETPNMIETIAKFNRDSSPMLVFYNTIKEEDNLIAAFKLLAAISKDIGFDAILTETNISQELCTPMQDDYHLIIGGKNSVDYFGYQGYPKILALFGKILPE